MTVDKKAISEIVGWVVTALAALVTAGMSFWLTNIHSQIEAIRTDVAIRSERLSMVEAYVTEGNRRLDRIESKLDVVVQRGRE